MSTSWRSGGYSLLPSPADLERYVHHLPDAAERLLAAAEREQAHRHQIETRLLAIDADAVSRTFESHKRVCWITPIIGLVYLAVMVVAILEGYATAGTGGAALGMAAVAWATRPPARPAPAALLRARRATATETYREPLAGVTEHKAGARW